MPTSLIVILIITGVLIAGFIALTIFSRRMQKKQEDSQTAIRQNAQTYSALIIDKKRMKLLDAGFPQIVIDSTPKYARRFKVPVLKAKIGPKVANLMCDDKVFDLIPLKKEVKLVMNGIYVIEVKGLRGALEAPAPKKKFFARLGDKARKKYYALRKEEQAAKGKDNKGNKNNQDSQKKGKK
jgi:hypothetical protein